MRSRNRLRRDDGASIVEVILAFSMFSLLLMGVLSTLDSGTRTERASQAKQDTVHDLRTAVGRMTKDIRQAVSIQPTSNRGKLIFRTIIAGEEKNMTYEVDAAGDLHRLINNVSPGVPLATHVTNGTSVFCYDPPTCVLSAPTPPFTRVRITLTGVSEVGTKSPITFATDVELRNL